jgi:hypothetical protein
MLLIVPVAFLLIWFGLDLYALNDLLQPGRRVRGYDKNVWALVIVLGSFAGVAIYYAMGREPD